MPKTSVIITTHNRVRLLARAIESVKLPGNDIEIVVVDDASIDETQNFCSSLAGIKYVRLERNQKTAGSRNVGLAASTGEYICFLDDDDWRLPESFNAQISVLDKDVNCGLVYGPYLLCNQDGEILDSLPQPLSYPQGNVVKELLEQNFIPPCAALMRRECFYKIGLFDTSPQMVGIEDWDLWLRIAEFFTIKAVDQPVAVYRKPETGSGQWSSHATRQFSLVANAYKKKWFNLPGVKTALGNDLQTKKKLLLNRASDKILYDAVHNSKGMKEKLHRLNATVKCYPSKLIQAGFYKAVIKSFLTIKGH